MTAEERAELETILGHQFQDTEELERALIHRSHRQNSNDTDNERLEFLGDRVLGLVASEELCRRFPDWDSGKLSKGLARLVSASSIHSAAKQLKLGDHLRLGPGEEKTGGRDKKRLLADAYEAILGAIYLDAGLKAAAAFVQRTLLAPALASRPSEWIAPTINQPCRNGSNSAVCPPSNIACAASRGPTIRKYSKWKFGTPERNSPQRRATARKKRNKALQARRWNYSNPKMEWPEGVSWK